MHTYSTVSVSYCVSYAVFWVAGCMLLIVHVHTAYCINSLQLMYHVYVNVWCKQTAVAGVELTNRSQIQVLALAVYMHMGGVLNARMKL
jgi:hypothetical protein